MCGPAACVRPVPDGGARSVGPDVVRRHRVEAQHAGEGRLRGWLFLLQVIPFTKKVCKKMLLESTPLKSTP